MYLRVPFNKAYIPKTAFDYIEDTIRRGKISGDGFYTKKVQEYFKSKYNFKHNFLTTSCTDAIEMASILMDIKPGDEIIAPSFTFVSTVNPFILRGAKIIFIDSEQNQPNIAVCKIEQFITSKTKAIVCVHYAGVACDMDFLSSLCQKHKLFLVEDAAQSIDTFYKNIPLGSFGDFAAFSFHETKNITSGEGGMLVVNNHSMVERAEIIREKGTNRSKFFRGEIDKYNWVDVGSSFLPSDINAAILFSQLEILEKIQLRRCEIWNYYYEMLLPLERRKLFNLPFVPEYSTNNAHLFYLLLDSTELRDKLLRFLNSKGINAIFHYQSLHKSEYYQSLSQDLYKLNHAERFSDCLIRLPLFYELSNNEQLFIVSKIYEFFNFA